MKLVDMGKTHAEIADIFSISQSTVSRKLRRLGIRAQSVLDTRGRSGYSSNWFSEKKTTTQIAKILGRTEYAVSNKRIALGIDALATLSAKNPLHLAEVIKFRMAGWTLEPNRGSLWSGSVLCVLCPLPKWIQRALVGTEETPPETQALERS